MVQQLEENEEDLVLEIENIAKERHALELQYHGKCQENVTLSMSITELTRKQENTDSEINLILKKLESEQKKSKELMW